MSSDREGESISIRSYVSGGGAWGRDRERGRGELREIPGRSMYLLNLSTIHSFFFFESQSVVHNSLGS